MVPERVKTIEIDTLEYPSIGYESGKCTLAVQGGILGGHKSAPVSHKRMLSQPSFSSPLINEDLPAGPQLVFTFNNRFSRTGWAVSQSVRYIFFRHQACYSLLPAKPGRQADRVISLCKYKVVVLPHLLSLYLPPKCARKYIAPSTPYPARQTRYSYLYSNQSPLSPSL